MYVCMSDLYKRAAFEMYVRARARVRARAGPQTSVGVASGGLRVPGRSPAARPLRLPKITFSRSTRTPQGIPDPPGGGL